MDRPEVWERLPQIRVEEMARPTSTMPMSSTRRNMVTIAIYLVLDVRTLGGRVDAAIMRVADVQFTARYD